MATQFAGPDILGRGHFPGPWALGFPHGVFSWWFWLPGTKEQLLFVDC